MNSIETRTKWYHKDCEAQVPDCRGIGWQRGTPRGIGRVGTGITDAELESMTELLRPYIESQAGKMVTLTPEIVLEVGYEEIQRSSNYSSGYALRFPRVVAMRDDKKSSEADTLKKIEQLFKS